MTFADDTDTLSAGDILDIRTNTGYSIQLFSKITSAGSISRAAIGKCPNIGNLTSQGEYAICSDGASGMIGRFFDSASQKSTAAYLIDTVNPALYTITIDITNGLLSFYLNGGIPKTVAINTTAIDFNNGSSFILNTTGGGTTSRQKIGRAHV